PMDSSKPECSPVQPLTTVAWENFSWLTKTFARANRRAHCCCNSARVLMKLRRAWATGTEWHWSAKQHKFAKKLTSRSALAVILVIGEILWPKGRSQNATN